MLKDHPKGLFVAFFANMGERFGYYTMLAIFTLYLQAKFGFDTGKAGDFYGGFLFGIYFLPLLGGFLADRYLGYGKTITIGTIIMFLGYVMLAIPDQGLGLLIGALVVISLGTGLFKGNLQALVGNMYDDPKYSGNRDNAFNIFYMGINIGAFFAPSAATGISNFILSKSALFYEPRIPNLAHRFLDGKLSSGADFDELVQLAEAQTGGAVADLGAFCHTYIDTLSQSYNAGFAIAAVSMILSLIIFKAFKKYYKSADVTELQKAKNVDLKDQVIKLNPAQIRSRLVALGLVFFVVMFFWMAFHQNGFTMTVFARDYTANKVSAFTYMFFDLRSFLLILAAIIGLVFALRKKSENKIRLIGFSAAVVFGLLSWYVYNSYDSTMTIYPQKFQHFNPIFIVFLTPLIVSFFSSLRKNNREPSSPRKIGVGMILTAIGFIILIMASRGLSSPSDLAGGVSNNLVSPYWLISTYFTLTIAELFLSPIGISFVSQVAPPKYKGLAQGGWLGATALGNLMAGIIGRFWVTLELWQFFLILVVMCVLSAIFIFSVLRLLENATKD
jgi:proton-dependent oligopeptide transporter, POT family